MEIIVKIKFKCAVSVIFDFKPGTKLVVIINDFL